MFDRQSVSVSHLSKRHTRKFKSRSLPKVILSHDKVKDATNHPRLSISPSKITTNLSNPNSFPSTQSITNPTKSIDSLLTVNSVKSSSKKRQKTTTTTTIDSSIVTTLTDTTTTTTTSTTTTTTTTSTLTTTTTTVTTTTDGTWSWLNMTALLNYDMPGHDIANNSPLNFTTCCTWCVSMSACVGFVWGWPNNSNSFQISRCWLKGTLVIPTPLAQFTAAFF